MIPVGRLELGSEPALLEARGKIRRMLTELGADAGCATRIATATSAAGRAATGADAAVEVCLRPGVGACEIGLRFVGSDHANLAVILRPFFDFVAPTQEGGVEMRRTFTTSIAVDESRIEAQRRLLTSRSRAELVDDVRRKNAELEQHRQNLERKVHERTLELSAAQVEADRANLAKSDFLSNMSHELRTPLNGVLGYVQLLLRDPDFNPDQRESLDAIRSCGRHLLTLINDVLDFSKIEAGRLDVEILPCRIRELVRTVCDITRPRAVTKGLVFESQVDDRLPEGIATDEPKLRQVLVNLLGNAVKFTRTGRVQIVTEVEDGGARVLLRVLDTGDGMTPEELAVIFDPFKQVSAGKASGGTGLGLAISQRIARALGGELIVKSERGVGSEFIIAIPLLEVEVDDAGDAAGRLVDDSGPITLSRMEPGTRVLVVDDNSVNRDVLVRLLADAGIVTAEASDGVEALEQLRGEGAALVLMDLRMPRMDGYEATRQIRADAALQGTVVVAVSASFSSEAHAKLSADGFDDFIAKPIRAGVLIRKIAEHLGVPVEAKPVQAAQPPRPLPADSPPLDAETARDLGGTLRALVHSGDIEALGNLADQLAEGTEAERALGGRLRTQVRGFDLVGLDALATEIAGTTGEGDE